MYTVHVNIKPVENGSPHWVISLEKSLVLELTVKQQTLLLHRCAGTKQYVGVYGNVCVCVCLCEHVSSTLYQCVCEERAPAVVSAEL